MPLTEIVLTTIAEKVFSYALDQSQSVVEDWVRKKLNLDPKQQAFKRSLKRAFNTFEQHYPQQAADLFNASFFEHEGAPILARFLVRDGRPDPGELATCWADSLNIHNAERRTTLVRDLEPAASDFLDDLARELKKEPELSDLNDSRTFEQLAGDLQAIRYKLGAEQATPGTLRDYLRWLIERNLYLDPRGTYQTQRQVQVKLDEVYISLRAQRDKSPGEVDRRLLEQEMARLEAKSKAESGLGDANFPILIRIADLLANKLAGGNCLVLLDGLDEIVSADDRQKVIERIQDFIRHHDNRPNRFLLTSRIAGYRSAPLGETFIHYTVQEMDETQMRRFLERWCNAVEEAQTPDLSQETRTAVAQREIGGIMQAVQDAPGVRRLAANPLLLALGFVGVDSPEDAADLLETAILAEGEEAEELGFSPSPYEDLLGRDYLFALTMSKLFRLSGTVCWMKITMFVVPVLRHLCS
jgi:hypothetical protein